MALLMQTLVDCTEAGEDSPRLGLFYGFSGYGKTVAAAYAAALSGAICSRRSRPSSASPASSAPRHACCSRSSTSLTARRAL
jgi:hypothetical protein